MNLENLISLLTMRREYFLNKLKNINLNDNLKTSYIHRLHEVDLIFDAINGKDALRKLIND